MHQANHSLAARDVTRVLGEGFKKAFNTTHLQYLYSTGIKWKSIKCKVVYGSSED